MRKLRQLCAALLLTLALTATASAGQMDCPGITSSETQAAGDIQNGITGTVILIMLGLI